MKKRNKYILAFIVVFIIAISVTVYLSKLNTSFNKVVLDHINVTEITSLKIIRMSSEPSEKKEIVVTDTSVIKKIMHDFSEIQLRKSSNDTDSNELYRYYITPVQDSLKYRFEIILEDKQNISIYDNDKSKNRLNSYTITNEFNSDSLKNLFK